MSNLHLDLLRDLTVLASAITEAAPQIERDRAVPDLLIDKLAATGVFRLAAPRVAGGLEADPVTMLEAFEELGRADGSTGWCAMIGAATSVVLGYLDTGVAAELLDDPRFVIAGVAAASGRARAVTGGYRVTGRWAFASGCRQATHLVGGCLVMDGDAVATTPTGAPQVVHVVVPTGDTTIHDTWTAAGLCGTGSHDFEAVDVFVPATHTFSLTRPPTGALYAFPVLSLLAMGIGAVSLGIARASLDEFGRLADAKVNPLSGLALAAKPSARSAYAEAAALHAAARAFLHDEVRRCWDLAEAGQTVTLERRARLRLAITTATTMSAQAVGLLYRAGGGSVAYLSSPLQRHFRDVNVATQHALVNSDSLELAGAVLLAQDVPTARL
ncbi:alkylation response protein AidB-like acyl-CoA dehydrogenase [Allocatelliglobosispora scoriae]|uniref:Alkylation response protein AidB-like acyl-CoA dehydrogenase n=1 Tax=Allocatelliglobosispora scoriae TaxID=643052 RepID=A0A841BF42_9ACTN|nr:acyl-CoA dehydrogenase family protein [Allocatelliglobosispora scoriae]MBB5867707.1 alkylation response protein AidB-like acyl-CoA dehydrogenase [Allocatelliglobosispora scoriae]